MNKLKDIIYDKNDLLIALVILLFAALVIYQKIDVIMDYPATMSIASATENEEGTKPAAQEDEGAAPGTNSGANDEESASDDRQDVEYSGSTGNDDQNEDSEESPSPSKKDVTLTIEYGATGSSIAQSLVDEGLLESRQDFYDAVNKAGADTKLQAGTFTIPAGSTADEIISIITE